jgi:calcineurin-like phosphoesterase family protein
MVTRGKVVSFLASVFLLALSTVCVMSLIAGCSSGTSRQSVEIAGVLYPAQAEPIVFAHVSDTHFGGETQLSGSGSDDPQELRYDGKALMSTLIADILPVVQPLATIHTGDLVNEGYQLKPWESYRDVVAGLSYPTYIEVPGNHDFKYSLDTADGKDIGHGKVLFAQYSKIGSTLGAGHDKYGVTRLNSAQGVVHLIRTNTSESPTDSNHENIAGYFTRTQQEAILNDSKLDTPAYLTVVLGHHPVTGENKIKTGNSYMQDLIANSKVKAPIYLCGHVHTPVIMWENNTLVVQADTFGRHGQTSSHLYLVGYDSGIASAKLVEVNATQSPNSVTWPIVMITHPANSALGATHLNPNPNPNALSYDPTLTPVIVLRSMVFSPASDVSFVRYSIDADINPKAFWLNLNNTVGRVWEGLLPLPSLQAGYHTVTVRATLRSGLYTEDAIKIHIQ